LTTEEGGCVNAGRRLWRGVDGDDVLWAGPFDTSTVGMLSQSRADSKPTDRNACKSNQIY